MIYLVIALKSEAQAFVDRYKLKKTKLGGFTLYFDEERFLIVSGIGIVNARVATQTLINYYDISDDDIYINVGVCGASKEHEIGSLLEIGEVMHNGIPYPFKKDKKCIVCVDEAVSQAKYDLVDMESYGFLDAVSHSPAIKNFYILKVVSDHFEPEKVTKEFTKSLIFKAINDINKILE